MALAKSASLISSSTQYVSRLRIKELKSLREKGRLKRFSTAENSSSYI